MHDVTKRPNKFLRRKQVGRCLVYLEEYEYDDQKRYYIEANGPDFRIWKRVKEDYHRAFEVYIMYRFWVWWIEAGVAVGVLGLECEGEHLVAFLAGALFRIHDLDVVGAFGQKGEG